MLAVYESLKRSWLDLEKRLGGLTADKLLSLSFHASLKRYSQALTDAIDSRLAIKPDLEIDSTEILNIASCLHQAGSSSLLMGLSSHRGSHSGRGGRGRGGFVFRGTRGRGGGGTSNNTKEHKPDSWGKKYLTAEFPCNVCWEWGHWAQDCPRVKKGLPPLDDVGELIYQRCSTEAEPAAAGSAAD